MPTWRELIAASGLPPLEAQILAAHVAGKPRSWLLAHDDEDAAVAGMLQGLYARRRAGEPVAYLTGEREFYGLSFAVSPAVLIPRPETELLVQLSLRHLPMGGRLLDVGTGSGAIAVAVAVEAAHERRNAQVQACDISEAALQMAQENARRHGAQIAFIRSDLLAAYAGECFDVIASNPPYVAEGDVHMSQGDVLFEPRLALTAGGDGMAVIRRLAETARMHLRAGGWLLVEHGHDQGDLCIALLRSLGYLDVMGHADLAGLTRVCAGRWPDGIAAVV